MQDGLGSVLAEVDPAGHVTASRAYDVYGAVRSTTGSATSEHAFVGSLGHTSEPGSGLIYMRARWYDPAAGRWLSEDPSGHGANWYTYCHDSPTSHADASGDIDAPDPWLTAVVDVLISYICNTLGIDTAAITGFAEYTNVLDKIIAILNYVRAGGSATNAAIVNGLKEADGGDGQLDDTEATAAKGQSKQEPD